MRLTSEFDLEQTASARRRAEWNVVIGKDKTMRTALALTPAILASLLWACPPSHAAPPARGSGSGGVEETIWALELAYFANLYRADYAGVLALVDPRFLAWPDSSPQPIDRDGSARFMRELIPDADDLRGAHRARGHSRGGRRRVDGVRAARRMRRRARVPRPSASRTRGSGRTRSGRCWAASTPRPPQASPLGAARSAVRPTPRIGAR